MSKKVIEYLEKAGRDPRESVLRWKESVKGKVIAGTIPDFPEEIVNASGALGQNILPRDIPLHLAESHLQNFACSYSRTVLQMLENKDLDYVDGIIVPHACDATRCLDLIIKKIKPFSFIEALYLPKYSSSPSARTFFREELNRIRSKLADFTGTYPDAELIRESIALVNRVKDALAKIKDLLKGEPPLVSASEYFTCVRAAMVLPKDLAAEKLEEFISEAESRTRESDSRPRIVLAGKIPEPPSIIGMIENAGLRIVDDSLVTGSRYILSKADADAEPLDALIDAQLNKIPFTGIWNSRPSRAAYVIEQARETNAKGVVMLVQKFCEPYEIDAPGIRMELENEKIPCLLLESDFREDSLEPLRTRAEAFAEMLKG